MNLPASPIPRLSDSGEDGGPLTAVCASSRICYGNACLEMGLVPGVGPVHSSHMDTADPLGCTLLPLRELTIQPDGQRCHLEAQALWPGAQLRVQG